jgi:hypothetical protein
MRAEASMTNNLVSTSAEVDAFLAELSGLTSASSGGRLIFALDATASRQPSWDTACQLQADMFRETAAIGRLSVQLVYYRGLTECRASRWISQPGHLTGLMERIICRGGPTQIGKVLAHARRETGILKVQALIFVGDAMEENPGSGTKSPMPRARHLSAFTTRHGAGPSFARIADREKLLPQSIS